MRQYYVPDVGVPPDGGVRFLLIEISCCRLLTPTSCWIYAFGSVGCVGSWFFSSVTNSTRKSLAVIVDLSVVVVSVLPWPEPVWSAAFAFAACFGISAEATFAAAAPTPGIELNPSIFTLLYRAIVTQALTLNQPPPVAYGVSGAGSSRPSLHLRYTGS